MADLKDFNFKHWWTLLAYAGGLIAIASAPKAYTAGILIGLGLLFFGIGQWIDRPEKMEKETIKGLSGFRTVPKHPWKPIAFGLIFEAAGIGFFGLGLFLLASA